MEGLVKHGSIAKVAEVLGRSANTISTHVTRVKHKMIRAGFFEYVKGQCGTVKVITYYLTKIRSADEQHYKGL